MNLFGMVMCGARAFAQLHAENLATFYKGNVAPVRRIRFVIPTVVIVDIDNARPVVQAMLGCH